MCVVHLSYRLEISRESLFNDEFVFVPLMNEAEVSIELNEFLELDAVQQFGKNLRMKIVDILESIDQSWVKWIKTHPNRSLVVALTGGGADLPMVQDACQRLYTSKWVRCSTREGLVVSQMVTGSR